jgi:hypothetical protein
MGNPLTEEQKRDAERIRRALEIDRRSDHKAVHAPKRGSCLVFVIFIVLLAAAALYVRTNWDQFEHLFERPTAPDTSSSPDNGY